MTELHFRRALQATARIAGLATLAACSPPVVATLVDGAPTDTHDDTDARDTDLDDPTCDDLLADLVEDYFDGGEAAADADTEVCCDDLIDLVNVTGQWPTDEASNNALSACCAAQGWPGNLACTPWGPPAPPAMRAVA